MSLVNKITIKNLKLNRKRTIVTIIGMMLSVALLVTVTNMYSSVMYSFDEFIRGKNYIETLSGVVRAIFISIVLVVCLMVVLISTYSIKNSFIIF